MKTNSPKKPSWDFRHVRKRFTERVPLTSVKVCNNCLMQHTRTTRDAVLANDGMIYFHCDGVTELDERCGSTLTVRIEVGA